MFETNTIPSEWVSRCNALDEIWVPTHFHVETFAAAGVIRSKIFVLGEPVDTEFFNPSRVKTPTILPMGRLLSIDAGAGGPDAGAGAGAAARASDPAGANYTGAGAGGAAEAADKPFRFLSIFKFEDRKGWDVLLSAFIDVFARTHPSTPAVELYLLTNTFHSDLKLTDEVKSFIQAKLATLASAAAATADATPDNTGTASTDANTGRGKEGRAAGGRGLHVPAIYVIDTHVPQRELPSLYAAADCFVLPSRGEGWGRPHVEAMAMGLPVIATNWSGPTAFLTVNNSYPLDIDGLEAVPSGPFRKHHRWASPCAAHLRQLMAHVVSHPNEAKEKGAQARADMKAWFSPQRIAADIETHFKRIQAKLVSEGDL